MPHINNAKGRPFVLLDDNGYMQLYTHDGNLVAGNLFLRIQGSITEPSTCLAKFYVNIVKDKEEMLSIINEQQHP